MRSTENIIPVDLFVRPADTADQDPTLPTPRDGDLLVERMQGHPVDDGTDSESVEGELGGYRGVSSAISRDDSE